MIVKHPSIWIFIRNLKDIQTLAERSKIAADRGELRPVRRRKWRRLEARLTTLKAQYVAGDRNLNSFWKAVSYLIGY